MLPSLLICPISNTGVCVSLAKRRMDAEHSRTCEILPGDDSMLSVEIVCMESMMTRSGLVFLMWTYICSSDVSHTMRQSVEVVLSRSARRQ